jgi:hypothetical protein
METIPAVELEAQGSSLPRVRPGIEIVHSPSLSRRHYAGPRPGRHPLRCKPELSTRDRLKLLRGQLRLLRMRAEAGMFVTPDALGRAERLANSLEAAA